MKKPNIFNFLRWISNLEKLCKDLFEEIVSLEGEVNQLRMKLFTKERKEKIKTTVKKEVVKAKKKPRVNVHQFCKYNNINYEQCLYRLKRGKSLMEIKNSEHLPYKGRVK